MHRAASSRQPLLRRKGGAHGARVTEVELFFDLVFVYAITQLSHALLHHLTLAGLAQTGLLFLAVWWVWIYTSWVTNWLDPNRTPVRIALFVLMLAGLVLSISIPTAFAAGGPAFAGAYVLMQVGRSLFMLYGIGSASATNTRNFQRILAWFVASGVFWLAGAMLAGEGRFLCWSLALAIEYLGPSLGFATPVLGRSKTTDWDVDGGHLAERCGLFVIIALGESLLVTGATFEKSALHAGTIAAFVAAFVGSAAMWWIYFAVGAERSSEHIVKSDDPGRLARIGYTYMHLPIIAGIIIGAVADELVLAHPAGHAGMAVVLAVLGGPAVFVLGTALFKRLTAPNLPLSHLAGLGVLLVLGLLSPWLPPLALGIGASGALVLVAAWEWRSLRAGRSEGSH